VSKSQANYPLFRPIVAGATKSQCPYVWGDSNVEQTRPFSNYGHARGPDPWGRSERPISKDRPCPPLGRNLSRTPGRKTHPAAAGGRGGRGQCIWQKQLGPSVWMPSRPVLCLRQRPPFRAGLSFAAFKDLVRKPRLVIRAKLLRANHEIDPIAVRKRRTTTSECVFGRQSVWSIAARLNRSGYLDCGFGGASGSRDVFWQWRFALAAPPRPRNLRQGVCQKAWFDYVPRNPPSARSWRDADREPVARSAELRWANAESDFGRTARQANYPGPVCSSTKNAGVCLLGPGSFPPSLRPRSRSGIGARFLPSSLLERSGLGLAKGAGVRPRGACDRLPR